VPSNVSRAVVFSLPANRPLHNPGKGGDPIADIVNKNNALIMLDHDIHKEEKIVIKKYPACCCNRGTEKVKGKMKERSDPESVLPSKVYEHPA